MPSLTDKVAQESKDSATSDHPMHEEARGAVEHGDKATAQDHQSKGPQVPSQDMPDVEGTKEELQEKAKALNK